MDYVIFLIANYLVFLNVRLIIRRFFAAEDGESGLIVFFILYLAQVIISLELLGILRILSLFNALILHSLILLTGLVFIRQSCPAKISHKPGIALSKPAVFVLAFIAGFAIVKIFINLINPPFGWDSLNYHFTFAVEWLKNGNLDNPIVVSDDPFPAYYPINGSLLFLWLILPFKSAYLADLGQLPFFIIAFFAVFSIGKKLRLNNEHSFFASSLFVIIPNFFKQLQIGYVDLMLAALFLVSINFILALRERFNIKNVIILAVSFGIFIGVKTTALPYGLLVFMVFIYLLFTQRLIGLRSRLLYMALFFLLIFIFGCFGYLRNFILTANPFYPLEVKMLGTTLFKGVIDKATFISRNEQAGYFLAKLLFHEGLGIQSLLIILPAGIMAFPLYLYKNRNRDSVLGCFMLLPLLLYLIYRFILPIPNSRYLYPALGMGMIVGFYILDSLRVPDRFIRTASIIIVIASLAECARHLELIVSFAAGLLLLIGCVFYLRSERLKNILFSKARPVTIVLIFIFCLGWLFSDYRENEYGRYIKNSRYGPDVTQSWAWLNENTKGDNIAYVGKPLPFPLYGTGLKNNVYYVSVNSVDPIHLHDLKNSNYRWPRWTDDATQMHKSFEEPDNYRGGADYAAWLRNLKKRNTDLLFIYSLQHTKDMVFPLEDGWAENNPEEFKLVFSNDTVRVYRLNI
ncbi:MAG: hypothetical protein PHR44_06605 [Candidatus Omnitrophica bacterium]|nr:hypothetical protein [Candidatus Omnitrophota bacterium]